MRYPDFYIVGAPKCGTSSMVDYLRQHPDIFMPVGEPGFFGSDLRTVRGAPDETEYLGEFQDALQPIIGEKSALYLYSVAAAEEIHDRRPDAKIIIMLRHPADMLHSWHAEACWIGNEDITDFAEALAAEPDRAAGRRRPPGAFWLDATLYRSVVAAFAGHVERYLTTFGPEQVLVVILEEFLADPEAGYRRVLGFLGADPSHIPSFGVVNPAKAVRSRRLGLAISVLARRVAPRLGVYSLPKRWRRPLSRLYTAARTANTRVADRRSVDPALRNRLVEDLASEVDAVEELLGRRLPSWRR